MTSEWQAVPGYPAYEVHPDGQVRSVHRAVKGRDSSERNIAGKILTPTVRPSGVSAVNLWRGNSCRQIPLREVVLTTFDRPKPAGFEALNINGDLSDNRLGNLRWQRVT